MDAHKLIEKPAFDTIEASEYLGVHEMTIYRWLKRGVIPGFKIGGRWRIHKEKLDELLTTGKFTKER